MSPWTLLLFVTLWIQHLAYAPTSIVWSATAAMNGVCSLPVTLTSPSWCDASQVYFCSAWQMGTTAAIAASPATSTSPPIYAIPVLTWLVCQSCPPGSVPQGPQALSSDPTGQTRTNVTSNLCYINEKSSLDSLYRADSDTLASCVQCVTFQVTVRDALLAAVTTRCGICPSCPACPTCVSAGVSSTPTPPVPVVFSPYLSCPAMICPVEQDVKDRLSGVHGLVMASFITLTLLALVVCWCTSWIGYTIRHPRKDHH